MKNSYESVYGNLAVERGRIVLLQPIGFFMRRLLMVYIVVFGSRTYFLQISLVMLSTMILMVIVISTRAFSSTKNTRDNIIGDCTVLIITYMFYIFDIIDIDYLMNIGYIPIAVIGLYIVVNLTIAIAISISGTRMVITRKCAKRSYTKNRKKFQQTLKMQHGKRKQRLIKLLRPEYNGPIQSSVVVEIPEASVDL